MAMKKQRAVTVVAAVSAVAFRRKRNPEIFRNYPLAHFENAKVSRMPRGNLEITRMPYPLFHRFFFSLPHVVLVWVSLIYTPPH